MIIDDVGLLAVHSNRSKFYLHQMIKHNLLPSFVLLLRNLSQKSSDKKAPSKSLTYQGFNMGDSVLDLLKKHKIPFRIITTIDPNSKEVIEALKKLKQSIIIYSGPGGAILRKEILNLGKRFLHIHTGILPNYRGSTTIYYLLLNEGSCGATALLLDEKIDTGPVIRKKFFPPPEDRTKIDLYYDPFIRSELLIEVLEYYSEIGNFSVENQEAAVGETYYIIHPVLKHIAILSPSGTINTQN